jgi:2',3'-cyclic-nucleotide 3'-phosphodiesterase
VTLHVERDPALVGLAKRFREKFTDAEAERWAVETFTPHVSLVYAAMEKGRIEGEGVLGKVLEEVGESRVLVGGEGEAEMAGWKGGRIVLVNTWKDIAEWVPVAEREI